MKKIIPVLCVILLYGVGCSGPAADSNATSEPAVEENPSAQLEGVWKLTKVTMTSPDTTTVTTEFEHPSYKILTGDHWAFGYQTSDSTIMAGGGTFSYDGNDTYSENVDYHSVSGVVGQTITFKIELDSTTWHHVGTITTDGGETTLDEIWEKVE